MNFKGSVDVPAKVREPILRCWNNEVIVGRYVTSVKKEVLDMGRSIFKFSMLNGDIISFHSSSPMQSDNVEKFINMLGEEMYA